MRPTARVSSRLSRTLYAGALSAGEVPHAPCGVPAPALPRTSPTKRTNPNAACPAQFAGRARMVRRRSSSGLYLAEIADELEIATMRLLISRSASVGAHIARSPPLGVMRLRVRLNAVSATTIHTSQRDTRDHAGNTSPARAKITVAIPAMSTAWIIAPTRMAGGYCPGDAPPIA